VVWNLTVSMLVVLLELIVLQLMLTPTSWSHRGRQVCRCNPIRLYNTIVKNAEEGRTHRRIQ